VGGSSSLIERNNNNNNEHKIRSTINLTSFEGRENRRVYNCIVFWFIHIYYLLDHLDAVIHHVIMVVLQSFLSKL
jgi:hypothetical protein